MKKVPTVYLPATDTFIRVGDLIVWNVDTSEAAGIAGNHDVLRVTGIETGTRKTITNVSLDWECIDCDDNSGWAGNRAILASCVRKLTELEYKRVIKDIGVE